VLSPCLLFFPKRPPFRAFPLRVPLALLNLICFPFFLCWPGGEARPGRMLFVVWCCDGFSAVRRVSADSEGRAGRLFSLRWQNVGVVSRPRLPPPFSPLMGGVRFLLLVFSFGPGIEAAFQPGPTSTIQLLESIFYESAQDFAFWPCGSPAPGLAPGAFASSSFEEWRRALFGLVAMNLALRLSRPGRPTWPGP